jgi:AmmeMemoRadiSam system protein A
VGFKTLSETIVEMARAAAFRDPRFPPVRENELKEIDIEVSILSELIRVETAEDIVVGRDGLLIEHPYGSGVLLPQVPIEWGWDRHTYLVHLCRTAGLSDDAWTEQESKLYRFTAEVFSEREFE